MSRDLEAELRGVLQRKADAVEVPTRLPPRVLRRAHLRRTASAAAGGVAALLVVVAGVIGAGALAPQIGYPPSVEPTAGAPEGAPATPEPETLQTGRKAGRSFSVRAYAQGSSTCIELRFPEPTTRSCDPASLQGDPLSVTLKASLGRDETLVSGRVSGSVEDVRVELYRGEEIQADIAEDVDFGDFFVVRVPARSTGDLVALASDGRVMARQVVSGGTSPPPHLGCGGRRADAPGCRKGATVETGGN